MCYFSFYACYDFGIDNCGNWLNNWFGNLMFNNLGSKSEFSIGIRAFVNFVGIIFLV